jgi:hypothetical protein
MALSFGKSIEQRPATTSKTISPALGNAMLNHFASTWQRNAILTISYGLKKNYVFFKEQLLFIVVAVFGIHRRIAYILLLIRFIMLSESILLKEYIFLYTETPIHFRFRLGSVPSFVGVMILW